MTRNQDSGFSPFKIAVVGKGNVGAHIFQALKEKAEVYSVDSRNPDSLTEYCDVALICVKDDAIGNVVRNFFDKTNVIAHMSGSVSMDVLKNDISRYGVIYPLQTFTKGVSLDYSQIPFFIEGSDETATDILSQVASLISPQINYCSSERRKMLHLASVFACNFSNALFGISYELLRETGINPHLLLPLLKQTVSKLDSLSPRESQTGPAARKDFKTMFAHKEMLDTKPEIKEIYELISDVIMNNHH